MKQITLNNFKKPSQKKENWFERNQSYWSLGATLISAAAFIVSIFVMLDQRNFAKTQFIGFVVIMLR